MTPRNILCQTQMKYLLGRGWNKKKEVLGSMRAMHWAKPLELCTLMNILNGRAFSFLFVYRQDKREVIMRKILFLLLFLVIFASSGYAATIYRWVDGKGGMHFGDDYTLIPPQYRDQVKTEDIEDSPQTGPSVSAPPPSQKSDGVKRDAYGIGEDYWRDRVRPWQNQLKEAQANIQSVDVRINGLSDGISGRFLSSTQRNMYTSELKSLKGERDRYEAQANEAAEMLKKIAGEAEAIKADPAWLK